MCTHVIIRQCGSYNREAVESEVHSIFEALGGIRDIVRKGQLVCLKPNMLSPKDPEMSVTTHPHIVEAVAREVQSTGGKVVIGDSPSGAYKGLELHWQKTGLKEAAERTGAKLINFEAAGSVKQCVNGRNYHISKVVLEADLVINLPKLKTHGLTLYTGALKNLYGTLPGYQKATYHKQNVNPVRFSEVVADIYQLVPVALHLMDGILSMAGNGPSTGDIRKTNVLLASRDGVALDTVAAALMGFRAGEIDSLRIAGDRGLGESRLENIVIEGGELESLKFSDFPLPSNRLLKLVPQFIADLFGGFIWVKPVIEYKNCTGCAVCSQSCPVDAITMKDKQPVIDYEPCISCLCCNESCPEGAITQKRSWLARQVG